MKKATLFLWMCIAVSSGVPCTGTTEGTGAVSIDTEVGSVLLSRGKESEKRISEGVILSRGDIVRTKKDGSAVFRGAGRIYKLFPYGKVRIEEKPVLIYGKLVSSQDSIFGNLSYTVTPKPAQGNTMKVLVRPKGAVRTIQASLVDSKGNPRDLRLFPIGDGTYRVLCGFDTEARIEKYYLRFGFEDESGDTISVIHPFYLQKSTRETGKIILPEHTWALLSPSERKDREGDVLRAVLSTASEESLWNYTFRTPVEEPDPLSLFGKIRKYYINGAYSFTRSHRGVDLRGKRGEAVFAPNSGTVVLADMRVTTGNTIVIDHGQGVFTLLFHMDALHVETGAYVAKGQRIGEIGATGIAEGAHLHWGMCVDGTYVDPMEWVRKTF